MRQQSIVLIAPARLTVWFSRSIPFNLSAKYVPIGREQEQTANHRHLEGRGERQDANQLVSDTMLFQLKREYYLNRILHLLNAMRSFL